MSGTKVADSSKKSGRGAPRSRRVSAEVAEAPLSPSSQPLTEVKKIHPIWGDREVTLVRVHRLFYRKGGSALEKPTPRAVGEHAPWDVTDPVEMLAAYGSGGRYRLSPFGPSGLACPAETFDVPDANGRVELYETPEMAAAATGAPAGPIQAPSMLQSSRDIVEMYRDLNKQAETARANDFQAFVKLMEARSGGGEGGVLVAFLQGELQGARAAEREARGALEALRGELATSREQLLRLKLGQTGAQDELISMVGKTLLERISGATGGGAAAAAAAGGGDTFALPTPEALRTMLHAGQVPAAVIEQAVKLHKVGGVPAALWEVIEPVASMAGLL